MGGFHSRREALGALGAAAVMATAVGAASITALASADPIFAAIETHRQREAEFGDVCDITDDHKRIAAGLSEERTEEIRAAASERSDAALYAMATTVPQTAAGVRAVISYFVDTLNIDYEPSDAVEAFLRSLLASPAIAGGANV